MKKAIPFLILAALLIGCSEDNTTQPTPEPEPIQPITAGNYWTFDIELYDDDSVLIARSFDSISISGPEFIEGVAWFGYGVQKKLRTDEMGLHIRRLNREGLWLKYPASVGETYLTRDVEFTNTVDTLRAELVSVDEEISVPAGTFTCYRYTFTDVGREVVVYDHYYAPGIGPVLLLKKNPFDGTLIVQRLASYQIEE
ncbi:MAG: hypothetical protein CL946_03840 [Ectothiorhodospiraceae bacterium]|nr:hypothetical protein [Ectothiorhodospiraceae bacterium]